MDQTKSQAPTVPPSPIPGDNKPNPHKPLVALLVVLTIFSFATGVYFYIQSQTLQKKIAQIQTTVTPTPTSDLYREPNNSSTIADWRTITLEYWQFKIPKDWHIANCNNTQYFIGPEIENDENDCKIKATFFLSRQTKKQLSDSVPYKQFENKPNATIDTQEITVGSKSAVIQTVTLPGGLIVGPRVYIENEDSWDDIAFDNEQKNIVNQILSTFKFLDGNNKGTNQGRCVTAGCSGQLCQDESESPTATTCEYKSIYACNKYSKCERQPDGNCGWTRTKEYESCLLTES